MDPTLFISAALAAVLIGLVGALLGLAGVTSRRTPSLGWRVVGLSFGVAVVGCAAGAAWLGLSPRFWAGLLLLGLATSLQSAIPLRAVEHLVTGFSGLWQRPRLQAGFLLAASPLLAVWCTFQLLSAVEPTAPLTAVDVSLDPERLQESSSVHAFTDQGRPVPLYRMQEAASEEGSQPLDDASIARQRVAQLIRTAPPELVYNCHGWVFAAGRHWLRGRDVDNILEDNGYHAVPVPQVGDVIVYRDSHGLVLHSGLVRVAQMDLVLVESKWGHMGRYLHLPQDQGYGTQFTYYHTDRKGHAIQGSNGEPSTGSPVVPTKLLSAAKPG
jgi:hypothetical protein